MKTKIKYVIIYVNINRRWEEIFMDKQAQKAKEQRKALSFKEKIENFWYYHKVHLIIGVVVVALFIYTFIEFHNMTENDISIAYYSSLPISEEGVEEFKELIKTEVEDINASGTIDVGIIAAYADPLRDDEQTLATMTRLQAELMAGEHSAYIVDEAYRKIIEEDFGEIIENTVEITQIPEAKATLRYDEESKLFWITRRVYKQEMKDENAVKRHQNAINIEEILKTK